MNRNWTRWIHASLTDYVKTELENAGVVVHFEGLDRSLLDSKQDFVEFRWNGPFARELSRGYWELEVDLNFLVSSSTDREDTHNHKKVVGVVQSILTNSISIFKFGNTEPDDQTLLGCMQLRVDKKDAIETNYFGRMQDVELEQSTIEAGYCMTGKLE